MKIVLDTHLLIWAITDNKMLSEEARSIITDPDNEVFYSTVSIWEVVIKHMKSPESIPVSGWELVGFCSESGYRQITINERHALMVETLYRDHSAQRHNDPFDRMLLAQCKTDKMALLTHDETLKYYNEECIRIV